MCVYAFRVWEDQTTVASSYIWTVIESFLLARELGLGSARLPALGFATLLCLSLLPTLEFGYLGRWLASKLIQSSIRKRKHRFYMFLLRKRRMFFLTTNRRMLYGVTLTNYKYLISHVLLVSFLWLVKCPMFI